VEPILISLFLFIFQIKICQQILNVSYGFQHTYGESKWDHHPQFVDCIVADDNPLLDFISIWIWIWITKCQWIKCLVVICHILWREIQIKICQQILNVSYGFQHTYGESKWDHHPQFWHNFLIRFWQGFFLYIYIPYTISCLPVSNVSKISVYKICLEIYLCILNSEFCQNLIKKLCQNCGWWSHFDSICMLKTVRDIQNLLAYFYLKHK
jgi:hypothetical protein